MSLCHKTKPSPTIDIALLQSPLVSLRLKTVRSGNKEIVHMGLARLFSSGVCEPVVLQNLVAKSPERHDSFGSDFERLGAMPTVAGRAWRVYPERTRLEISGTSQISFNAWLIESSNDIRDAHELIATSPEVRDALAKWRNSYLVAANVERKFETGRFDVLRAVGTGQTPCEEAHVRDYPMAPYEVQAGAIRALDDIVSRADAEIERAPDARRALPAVMSQVGVDKLCHAMYALTDRSLSNKLTQIKYDRRDLFLLNDMTREAEKERSKDGANVPLRLAFRGDRCVLKPAKSRSWLTAEKLRAQREAANLAMLIGLPPGTRVTLDTLNARGFGRYESTVVLNDAKSDFVPPGNGASWLFNRIRDMERSAQRATDLLSELQTRSSEAAARERSVPHGLVDGDDADSLSAQSTDLDANLTSVKRLASVEEETSFRREGAVDEAASVSASDATPARSAFQEDGRRPSMTRAPTVTFGPDRVTRAHRQTQFEVIAEVNEDNVEEASVSSTSPHEPWRMRNDSGARVVGGRPHRDAFDGADGHIQSLADVEIDRVIEWSRADRHKRVSPSAALPPVLSRKWQAPPPPPLPKSPPPVDES